MARSSDKRDRLIEAGQRLFHQRGIANSSLAQLADESGVPLGNIYYYFKTKDDLVAAVAEHQNDGVSRMFEDLDRIVQPERRLSSFLDSFDALREERAAYGCPVGVLCQEMIRTQNASGFDASEVFATIIGWLERQFSALGCTKKRSRDNAIHILAGIQGASVVAQAFHDPSVVRSETKEMQRWLQHEVARLRGAPR